MGVCNKFAINLHSIAIAIEFWGKDQALMRFGKELHFINFGPYANQNLIPRFLFLYPQTQN